MRNFMRRVDRFCLTHPNFGVRNLMMYVAIGNIAVFLLGMMDRSGMFVNALSFNARAVFTQGQIWRLITFIFIPGSSNLLWAAVSAYFYFFLGKALEDRWGKGKLTVYYLFGMALNILFGVVLWLAADINISLNATYLNLSLFFAFATLFPETYVLLIFIPVKIKWIAIIDAVFFLMSVLTGTFPVNLLPVVAIFNYLLFCGSWIFDYFKPRQVRQRKKTIEFKNAAREYNRRQARLPYNRKCEVCGRTDRDHPQLEFRFCSRCQGYHCFCIDHINDHIHFTE